MRDSYIRASYLSLAISILVMIIILLCLYTNPNHPKFSIEDFSVVPDSKRSPNDLKDDDISFDLKLRNMNKAVGLYYEDPSRLTFTYHSLQEPSPKDDTWVYTLPAFYQGNGKTKHIQSVAKNSQHQPPRAIVDKRQDIKELIETDLLATDKTQYARSLLRNHLRLPSSRDNLVVVEKPVPAKVVTFRITLIINYRFKLWGDSSTHKLVVGADVTVDATTGERVTEGSINLV
uniref:Late embryogenesis abundant protein LEA-2 subgroup domain-containing protein n=1 Tax=Tanacetum cinerariifolium TaxID=118510 RepID=A0A699IR82_TANCI|nr:hypothetical protein [Tanacetum cinerariifolium]